MSEANDELVLTEGSLPVPKAQKLSQIRVWCEYPIWGLLHYDNQSPWMTLVETLHIIFHMQREGKSLLPGLEVGTGQFEHESVWFTTPQNSNLRHLLFDDDHLTEIAASPSDDDAMYATWFAKVKKHNETLDLSYIQAEFQDFGEFSRAVELLRTAEIEIHSVKRPTSRHLIPLGRSLLFADTDEKGGLDRRFIRRTGELLYLMLNRAQGREDVRRLLEERITARESPWDRLGKRLAGGTDGPSSESSIGYLPMPAHPAYDRLAEDWTSVLSLAAIPVENLLDPLARLSTFDQLLYIVERAVDVIGDERAIPPFVMDFTGRGGSSALRDESTLQYNRHRHLMPEAVEAFIDEFTNSEEWKQAVGKPTAAKEAYELIKKRFRFDPGFNTTTDQYPSPEAQISALRQEADSRNGHTISSFFVAAARKAGLLTSRQGTGTWYAPTDAFIEALVLANVTIPIEFDDFLAMLHRRYSVIIGRDAAISAYGQSPLPLQVLKENEERLEERLRILGFLDRKSDACAFVINPFHQSRAPAKEAPAYVDA